MKGFSKAIIAGNVTHDPEMRTTSTGKNVCAFTVAVNHSYKDASGNTQDQVSFLNCVAWGPAGATIHRYIKKGGPILVSGRLDQRSWEDKNGQKRSTVEIVVEDFNFLPGGERGSNNSSRGSSDAERVEPVAENAPEDIPNEEIDVSEIPF